MEVLFLVLLFVVGACLGSFLCCQARRLHRKATKKGSKSLGPRSVCLHCRRQLKWYDNIPIVSWLILRGKCRKCHKPIGAAELISELGTGAAFVAVATAFSRSLGAHDLTSFGVFPLQDTMSSFYTISPLNYAILILTFILLLPLIFLAIYDGLYGELPTKYLIVSIVIAAAILSLKLASALLTTGFTPELVWHPLAAALILGGLYLVLYLISHGRWVGDGDWLLALALALALGSPWLALITLFLANLFACLYAIPTTKKAKGYSIHLGPFLVAAFIFTLTFAEFFQSVL